MVIFTQAAARSIACMILNDHVLWSSEGCKIAISNHNNHNNPLKHSYKEERSLKHIFSQNHVFNVFVGLKKKFLRNHVFSLFVGLHNKYLNITKPCFGSSCWSHKEMFDLTRYLYWWTLLYHVLILFGTKNLNIFVYTVWAFFLVMLV